MIKMIKGRKKEDMNGRKEIETRMKKKGVKYGADSGVVGLRMSGSQDLLRAKPSFLFMLLFILCVFLDDAFCVSGFYGRDTAVIKLDTTTVLSYG
jgi:hypothetical protein